MSSSQEARSGGHEVKPSIASSALRLHGRSIRIFGKKYLMEYYRLTEPHAAEDAGCDLNATRNILWFLWRIVGPPDLRRKVISTTNNPTVPVTVNPSSVWIVFFVDIFWNAASVVSWRMKCVRSHYTIISGVKYSSLTNSIFALVLKVSNSFNLWAT